MNKNANRKNQKIRSEASKMIFCNKPAIVSPEKSTPPSGVENFTSAIFWMINYARNQSGELSSTKKNSARISSPKLELRNERLPKSADLLSYRGSPNRIRIDSKQMSLQTEQKVSPLNPLAKRHFTKSAKALKKLVVKPNIVLPDLLQFGSPSHSNIHSPRRTPEDQKCFLKKPKIIDQALNIDKNKLKNLKNSLFLGKSQYLAHQTASSPTNLLFSKDSAEKRKVKHFLGLIHASKEKFVLKEKNKSHMIFGSKSFPYKTFSTFQTLLKQNDTTPKPKQRDNSFKPKKSDSSSKPNQRDSSSNGKQRDSSSKPPLKDSSSKLKKNSLLVEKIPLVNIDKDSLEVPLGRLRQNRPIYARSFDCPQTITSNLVFQSFLNKRQGVIYL